MMWEFLKNENKILFLIICTINLCLLLNIIKMVIEK